MAARPLTSLYKVFKDLNPKTSEYKNKRLAMIVLLNDDAPDDLEDLEHLVRHAARHHDGEILVNVLKSLIKHNQALPEKLIETICYL